MAKDHDDGGKEDERREKIRKNCASHILYSRSSGTGSYPCILNIDNPISCSWIRKQHLDSDSLGWRLGGLGVNPHGQRPARNGRRPRSIPACPYCGASHGCRYPGSPETETRYSAPAMCLFLRAFPSLTGGADRHRRPSWKLRRIKKCLVR
jgi:hypothetical protein